MSEGRVKIGINGASQWGRRLRVRGSPRRPASGATGRLNVPPCAPFVAALSLTAGFGRIGRLVFRAAWANPHCEVVAINDPFMVRARARGEQAEG
jgi:hypothetical protein